MAWQTIDRNEPVVDKNAVPVLSEAVREKIRSFFPRYETKRAALLPALHVVQRSLGYVPWRAMVDNSKRPLQNQGRTARLSIRHGHADTKRIPRTVRARQVDIP